MPIVSNECQGGIRIRDMQDDDRPALHGFLTQLSAHELTIEPNRTADFEPNARQFDTIADEIASTGGFILVAEDHGQPIGYVSVIYRTSGSFIQEQLRRYAHIEDFFVAAEHRAAGVGRMLYNAVEARARRDGHTSIRLSAMAGNTMAHRAYRNWGFEPYAIEYIMRLNDAP